jgi:RNA polymerase sigma factor (sigma-70 family)
MRGTEFVASIVAGDPDGLAAAYDRYADPLYRYCQVMLSDPADAADAVRDTFVIAASQLAGLRDPGRLRAWLYAVARNECLRILRAKKLAPALDEAPGLNGDSADVGDGAGRAELRRLLRDAAAGLNPVAREVIELHLRHGLEPAEVAIVLGVSPNHAQSLVCRAREQLEACLGVLAVGRAARSDCAELRGMLTGWDGRLTVLLSKRVHRHIEHCATCFILRAFELRPAALLGLSPGAAMAAAAASSVRAPAGPPAGLKARTLALAAGLDPSAMTHRSTVLGRAGSFGGHGLPRQVHGPAAAGQAGVKRAPRSSLRGRAVVAAGVVLAAVLGAVALAASGSPGHVKLADQRPPGSASPPGASAAAPAAAAAGKSTAAVATPPAPSRSAPASTPPPTTTTTGSPAPSPASPTAANPTPTPAPTPEPTTGTLDVSPPGGSLGIPAGGATITLTAQDGAVRWWIVVSQGSCGMSVSPSSGTLRKGGTVTVTITAGRPASGEQVTIEPGGTVFTIQATQGPQTPRHSLPSVLGVATPDCAD